MSRIVDPSLPAHQAMVREKRRVALTSVFAAILLTGLKLGVGLWTGSLGILAEAAHSGLDLLAAVVTLFAVSISDRPADTEHQFGHGKVENLSAMIETILLLITCGWILYEAYERLISNVHVLDVNFWSFAVIGISIVVDFSRSRALYRVARKHNSQALEADALHFSTDIWSSLVVIVGLISVSLGFPAGDAISAAIVAIIVVGISVRLGKRTIDVLLDRSPEGLREQIASILLEIEGIRAVRDIRVRQSGAHLFAQVTLAVPRSLTFDQVHTLLDHAEMVVEDRIDNLDIIFHAEPEVTDDEPPAEALEWLVRQHGVFAHNIALFDIDGIRAAHFDVEVAPGTEFSAAHDTATRIENSIRDAWPEMGRICVHLEERRSDPLPSLDVTDRENDLVRRIRQRVEETPGILGCSSLHCIEHQEGLTLSISTVIAEGTSLHEVHGIVNTLETDLLPLDSRLVKAFIHAEPG